MTIERKRHILMSGDFSVLKPNEVIEWINDIIDYERTHISTHKLGCSGLKCKRCFIFDFNDPDIRCPVVIFRRIKKEYPYYRIC